MTKKLPLNSLSESVMKIVIYSYIITLCYNYNITYINISISATRLTYTKFITTCKIINKKNLYIFFNQLFFICIIFLLFF